MAGGIDHMDTVVYALLNKKIKGLASGIKSSSVSGSTITFTMNDGSVQAITFPTPTDGISIVDVDIDTKNQLYVTLSDGQEILAGTITTLQGERGKQGEQGTPGVDGKSAYELAVLSGFVGTQEEWIQSLEGESPTIMENPNNIGDIYKLDIINSDGSTMTTPNLKGAGGAEYFDNPDVTLVTVGGLTAGSNIYGESTKEVLEAILYPYQEPSVEIALSPSDLIYDIMSDELESVRIIVSITRKSNDISFIKFYANDELIYTVTDGYTKGGTFNYQYTPENPITSSVIFKISVNDGQNNVEKTTEVKFVGKTYYGIFDASMTEPTENDIKTLNSVLNGTKEYTYNNISATDGKFCYAYPKEFDELTSIMDNNGFEYIDSYTRSIVSIDGIDYYVYLLTDAVSVENFKQIYE